MIAPHLIPRRLRRRAAALVISTALPAAVGAQPVAVDHAPFLPTDHWTREAVQRLATEGLVDLARASWAWPLTRGQVRQILDQALGEARQRGDPDGPASRYAARFADELGSDWSSDLAIEVQLGPSWTAFEGQLLGGSTYWLEGDGWIYPGPVTQPSRDTGSHRASLVATMGRRVGLAVRVVSSFDDVRLDEAFVDGRVGPLLLWAGRRATTLGPSSHGGLVLSGDVAVDGAGVALPDGFRLPGFLEAIGRVRPTLQLARLDRSGTVSRPWFAALRASLDLRPSLTIGLNRAAMFGGEGNREDLSLRNVALMTLGITGQLGKSSGFENQVASIDLQARFELRGTPMRLDVEWGFDDIGGAWTNVPGVLIGIEAPHLGGTGWTLGAEHVFIDGSCCGNPEWYRHGGLGEGWTDRGRLLGHPLGGHGKEWSIAADWSGRHLSLDSRLLLRDRGPENLFSPDWEGSAWGVELAGRTWIGGSLQIHAGGSMEDGQAGWRHWAFEAGGIITLGAGR